jgi:hypothetical protein
MLEPLKQFVCDKCGQIIEKPEDGWVEWLHPEDPATGKRKNQGFKIVHHSKASPLSDGTRNVRCYHYDNNPLRSDNHLEYFLGENGLSMLYAMVDPGPHFSDGDDVPEVVDFREYMEFLRRLTIPYYEEARIYWSDAKLDGFFSDGNEYWTYLPSTLQWLIRDYGATNEE